MSINMQVAWELYNTCIIKLVTYMFVDLFVMFPYAICYQPIVMYFISMIIGYRYVRNNDVI